MNLLKKLILTVIAFSIVASLSLTLIGCPPTPVTEEPTTTEEPAEAPTEEEIEFTTIKEGYLTVGTDAAYPPLENVEAGEFVGFDIDLVKEIANGLGLEAEIINTAWDGIFPALIAHKFDVVISAVTITEDRDKEMDFSDPYLDSDQSIATKDDSGIKTKADLKDKILGVQIGTTGELTAKEIDEEMGVAEIKTYDDILLAFEDLKAGRIDAIINDIPTSAYIVKDNPELVIVEKIITNEKYGIVFAPDTPELLKAVNKVLKEMKEDGTYDQIYSKWFGENK
ncbi:MAG: basic amino acid ABC transporter substrate-binding protein [Actinobacteria bacterium]|nr:basic amino acid ABC transporter substrate-binding protein [Actinomycetota bacterium]